jgi:hypothetical protein
LVDVAQQFQIDSNHRRYRTIQQGFYLTGIEKQAIAVGAPLDMQGTCGIQTNGLQALCAFRAYSLAGGIDDLIVMLA